MPFASSRPIRHSMLFALAAMLCQARGPAAAEPPPPEPAVTAPAALVMHKRMLADPYAKMDAVSILVPAGWEMGGTVNWVPGSTGGPEIDLTVFDTVRHAAVRMYPGLSFNDGWRETQRQTIMRNDPSGGNWAKLEKFYAEGANMVPGVEICPLPKSPREFVQNLLVPKLRPALAAAKDITVVGETDMPDVAAARTKRSVFPNSKFMCARIRITYTGPKGPMEEEFICTIRSYPAGRPVGSETNWSAETSSALAPAGKLDALLPTANAIIASRQQSIDHANFSWQIGDMINKRWNAALQKAMADETERIRVYGEMQRAASAELSQEIRDRFQRQQETKAAVQENFLHYVNDEAAYINPGDHSKVILPANYTFNYVNDRGETFQTMNANEQPPVDPRTSWTRMEKAR